MKILLPLDGSESSRKTLAWVTTFFGQQDKATLDFYLLHVVELIPEVPITDYDLDEAMKTLSDARQMLTEKGFRVAASEYVVERPARAICLYADEQGIDQIVMGSHGRSGLLRFLVGSVSSEVAEQAKQPVLIYHNGPKSSLTVSQVDQVSLTESTRA